MDFLDSLNPQQRAAVTHVNGPLLLLAGAGSGKTRVITHRIAHLVQAHQVPGPCILAVTFTNKAASEMRQRVQKLLGNPPASQSPVVSTFHSFCVRLLRRDGKSLAELRPGFTPSFTIYDDDDQMALLRSIYRHLGITDESVQYRAALSWISGQKGKKESPQDSYAAATDQRTSRLAAIYDRYESGLRQSNALDFDDLLHETVRLLTHNADLRAQLNRRHEFLMIDEYQDTNHSQYELMRLLSSERGNVCVVGDEDQSIYGWRGADIRNILDFERDYPGAAVIRLEQNYRSTKNILEAASAVVANNIERKGKWLWTESGAGAKIGLYQANDGENEALFIADSIDRLLREDSKRRIAVLYRTNSQSRQIEEALRRYGRKYTVVGGLSFYQRAEIKDALSYLRLLTSRDDSMAFARVVNTPARGIGKTTLEQIDRYGVEHHLGAWAAMTRMLDEHLFPGRAESALSAFRRLIEELSEFSRGHNVQETLAETLARTGYRKMLEDEPGPESDSRLNNLEELLSAAAEAAERGEEIKDFLDHAALVADADSVDERSIISLLTIHNAKGLEFPVVFLAGMEEGLFPHSRSLNAESAMEEERRLCYVGMTRAEQRLYLTWARYRRRFGGGQPEAMMPSRFLKEVPRELIENLREDAASTQVDLFAERHEVRETAKRNLYTGKTYNSVENIAQFFASRQMPPPRGIAPRSAPDPGPGAGQKNGSAPPPPSSPQPSRPPSSAPVISIASRRAVAAKPMGSGAKIIHPKYGRGTILKREGDGDDAKLTINFPKYGLKKLIEKFAGIKVDE
ncbi:MAG TPA: UvrD-helicase domain-containing protein [Bryobacteraceae bacterium]|jgi:DNA helicase-2/ATP-dependent DNA helicase PcrA|nr:UvrD-helicase domain-containing protein [Bryobacteraceae bacterium]